MLFGQSVFQSVLTRLEEDQEEESSGAESVGFRISGLSTGFVQPTDGQNAGAGDLDASAGDREYLHWVTLGRFL